MSMKIRSRLTCVALALAVLGFGCAKKEEPAQTRSGVPEPEMVEVCEARVEYDLAPAPMSIRRRSEAMKIAGGHDQPLPVDREGYDHLPENVFRLVSQDPLSTFSVDVDTAGYANVRRMINQGSRPPVDAVRIEELINYFTYDYPEPESTAPFSVAVEVAGCPWNGKHRLARIGLKGRSIDWTDRPSSNLVFLMDVSGSMDEPNKLPLVKKAMKMLVETLGENDRVAIVVYAGAAGLALPSTTCDRDAEILEALEGLRAGGSTAGGAGIQLAYRTAEKHFIAGGINRVILCTDGDFNVGATDRGSLVRLIEEKARGGVFLTVLGFGMGNLQDSTLEALADKGNGNYGYIDSELEARKVLVREAGGTLMTIAKDVKIQVEFNPLAVAAYRLVGYENRILAHQDFSDDKKDAGDIGAGHTVTAFYEIVPAGESVEVPGVDPLRYQTQTAATREAGSGELMNVKLRYKDPDGERSTLIEMPVADGGANAAAASEDFRFASGVAAFGMVMRDSKHRGSATLELAVELARTSRGLDPHGYRAEFIDLVGKAKSLLK